MELFRIFKSKKFMSAVILLLLLNCVFFYITQQKSIEALGLNIDVYSDVFKKNAQLFTQPDNNSIIEKSNKFQILKSFADTEKIKGENAEEYEYYAEEEAQLIKEYPDLYQEYKNGNYSYDELTVQADFYSHFAYQLEYQNDYPAHIESILENADSLSSKKLFSNKNSYSYKSIQKSAEDFSKNKNLDLSLVNDLPVNSVLNYQIGDFILILMCVFMAISFVSEKNVNLLVNTCKNGRSMLKVKQLPILILFSVFSSFFIYVSEIIISLKIYNAPLNLYVPIQSSEIFSDCILHINFLQLFAIHILFKAVIAIMIAFVIWLLISISNNIILVSAVAEIIAAAELLLYKNISVQSNLSFFKTFNIFSLFDYRSITEYNLVSLFSVPVRADIITWSIVFLTTFTVSLIVVLTAKRNYPVKTPRKAFSLLNILFKKLSVFYVKLQEFFYAGRFESFKIIHISKGILVIVAFVCIIGFNFNTNPLVFSSTEMFLNDYYEQYGGELKSTVYESIEKMQAESEAVESEFNLKSGQYSNGEITLDEYEQARAKNVAYDTQRKAVDELIQQVDRIEQLSDKGIKPVLINEIGYNNLFYSQSNQTEILLLICAVVIMFSSVFSIEKTSNMIELNHCSKNGRIQLYFKKILTVTPKTFVLTAISYIFLIIQNHYIYQLDNLNADIHNLECLQDIQLNVSILEYLILNFVFEFVFITITALVITSLSAFASQIITIIVSACIFILPSALYTIDVYSAKAISTIYLFNFNALILDKSVAINSFIIHFILIAFCIMMLVWAQRKWCLTKDR